MAGSSKVHSGTPYCLHKISVAQRGISPQLGLLPYNIEAKVRYWVPEGTQRHGGLIQRGSRDRANSSYSDLLSKALEGKLDICKDLVWYSLTLPSLVPEVICQVECIKLGSAGSDTRGRKESSPIHVSAKAGDWADGSATSDRPGQGWGSPQACPLRGTRSIRWYAFGSSY
ncbi:uncharacterized protein BO88DRAFT_436823 [Aspergillus vadensis CBS 113365]|uniref:Uncharacterized protein n=1 Tax=Aspergillus vadensis (strain CBS 113365 / IMI 142717 / IBT 24658) TaxID=1448311 RepID=A0A319CFP8_ASPVC|nr:hypothetical protein BO88DRAFT_436823 [Aspergillus vadensis CBS 113365]PYH67162.1 hypothetical protein BO88DRAFT_436823 [Aspergillus vadensis CBS 113365]